MEVPKINVLNLTKRIDRRDNVISEFKKQNITSYEFWTPISCKPSFVSISKSHKMIVRDAKIKGLDMCCISEDDVKFSDIGAWKFYLDKMPKTFDLYLSSTYYGVLNQYNVVDEFSALTLYIIHSRYYDTFLSTPEFQNIDRAQSERRTTLDNQKIIIPKGRFVVCNPFTTFQIEGFSDNVGHETDYFNTYMVGRKFYARSVAENKALIATSL